MFELLRNFRWRNYRETFFPLKKKKSEKRKKNISKFYTYHSTRTRHGGNSTPPQSTVTSVQFVQSCLNVPAGFALAGLELDEPLVHRLQDGRVHLLHDVLQLVGVCLQVVDLHKRLCVGGGGEKHRSLWVLSHSSSVGSRRLRAARLTSLSANSQYCMSSLPSRVRTQA